MLYFVFFIYSMFHVGNGVYSVVCCARLLGDRLVPFRLMHVIFHKSISGNFPISCVLEFIPSLTHGGLVLE